VARPHETRRSGPGLLLAAGRTFRRHRDGPHGDDARPRTTASRRRRSGSGSSSRRRSPRPSRRRARSATCGRTPSTRQRSSGRRTGLPPAVAGWTFSPRRASSRRSRWIPRGRASERRWTEPIPTGATASASGSSARGDSALGPDRLLPRPIARPLIGQSDRGGGDPPTEDGERGYRITAIAKRPSRP